MRKVLDGFKGIVTRLNDISTSLTDNAHDLTGTTGELTSGACDQAQQSSTVAMALMQMNETVLDVAKNAQLAADASQKTSRHAEEGSDVVTEAVREMDVIVADVQMSSAIIGQLDRSSQQIIVERNYQKRKKAVRHCQSNWINRPRKRRTVCRVSLDFLEAPSRPVGITNCIKPLQVVTGHARQRSSP
jgi:hypothetical protein